MRIPDPKANTTTEAYLAYKAGYLEESELKPKLYEPYLHFDAWLAYWAGLTNTYPMKKSKNIFNSPDTASGVYRSTYEKVDSNSFIITSTSTIQGTVYAQIDVSLSPDTSYTISYNSMVVSGVPPSVAGSLAVKVGSAAVETPKKGERTFVTDGSGNVKFYFYLGFAESGGQITVGDAVKIYDIQLEQGREATEFEEYSTAPKMLCDEEALVAYLSGVTDTYPEEIKDPYDVRIVGYLRHLASIRWPEPDYPVNNEEFYLSTMEPTHTSNSEPSGDIELDTAEGKIISVEAYGDTYQQTYSGYNLIDLVPMTNTQPTTSQQCTFETVMDATLGRNVLHVTGTSSFPTVAYQLPQRLESGKYYALKFTYRSTVSGSPQSENMWFAPNWSNTNYWDVLGSINSGRAKPGDGDTGTSTEQSITWKTTSRRFYVDPSQHSSASSSYTNICFSLGYNANATKELWLADAELYEITEDEWNADTYTSKDYEPYTGGPAPNPDYPQDIQLVTGEQTVKVTGKNLLRLVQISSQSQGITATVNSDGSITVSGTASSTWANLTDVSTDITLSSGETYTFSIDKGSPVSIGLVTTGVARQDFNIAPGRTSVTATANYDNNALRLYMYGLTQNQSYDFTIYPQFERGSTATTYQPYQSQSYPISLGSIELCKIGDYQDYIYNSDGDWYLRKTTNAFTVTSSLSSLGKSGTAANNAFYLTSSFSDIDKTGMGQGVASTSVTPSYSKYFTVKSANDVYYRDTVAMAFDIYGGNTIDFRLGFGVNSPVNTLALFKTWLDDNELKVYYPIATPTDTKITDATLIGQLEALAGADTYNEKTYIKVTATDPNLPVLLKVEAYKY